MEIQPAAIYKSQLDAIEKPVLYAMPWWLDTVCGVDGWQVVIQYDEFRNIVAMMPFYSSRILGLSAIITPPLTQWLPIVSPHPTTAVSPEQLFSQLPETQILNIMLPANPGAVAGGFGPHVTIRYSFILPAAHTFAQVRSGYNEGLRRNLRAANETYTITKSTEIGLLLDLYTASHRQQGMVPPKWADTVIRAVYEQLISHQSGQLMLAYHQGQAIAGVLIGWDRHTSYYLAGGKIIGEQAASAHALLLDKAIEEAMANGRAFDFEGSMHPGIANFFQSFGASPQPYWQVRKFRGLGKLWSMFHK